MYVCLPTFNTAAAHPQTTGVRLQRRLTGELVSSQVAKNKHVVSKYEHSVKKQHTQAHTFYGGSISTITVLDQKGSLSFVDGTKRFFVIQLLNSNLIKATREVFIPLVQ